MPLQSPQDLFHFDLSTIYSAEQTILQVVSEMESESKHPQAKQHFSDFASGIRQHLTRLEECFRMIGQQPLDVPCEVADGFLKERQKFQQQSPSADLVDLYNMGLGIKMSHYVVGFYWTLVEGARDLGYMSCMSTLEDTLQESKSILQSAEQAGSSITRQRIQQSSS